MTSSHESGEVLRDFSDGIIFKQHDFKKNLHGIQIIAYYDEVETCNPLGSSSGKYTLDVYFLH